MSRALKSYLKIFLKIALVVGLLYFLSRKGLLSVQQTGRAFSNWRESGPALVAMLIAALLGAVRWQLLLRAQGTYLSWLRVTQLTLIGSFFNIALPGAVSGDFVKAFYIGKELGGQRARTFGSILFDRVTGLSALVLVSASALLLGFGEFNHSALMAGTRWFIVTAASCVLFFYAYLFLVREHHDPVLKALRAIESKVPKTSAVVRIYEGLRHYHNHRFTVLKALLISVTIHLLVGWACACFAIALGVTHLNLLAIYVVVPLGLLVMAIPVAPAGVGTGNLAFAVLFHFLGTQRGADIFTLMAIANILIGMVGGVIYLRFRSNEPAPELSAAEA